MKNLFIDSNIWLSLYHFTSDDLAQFEKLKELLGVDIRLWIPRQVYDEVLRNREAKLNEAFKTFDIKAIQYPVFCKQYEEYEKFSTDFSKLLKRYKEWKQKINEDMRNQTLPADKTIGLFFSSAGLVECDSIIDRAYARYKIGNPPGKDNKYGDAINWECLLNFVPNGEDLYFISFDKDYRSEMFDDMFNPFLMNEWRQKKNSTIHYYKNLVPFLNEHFKDIELKTEEEKANLIIQLKGSPNFVSTHGIISLMNRHSGWSDAQIEEICNAAEENMQVNWILADNDVYEFYTELLNKDKFKQLEDCSISRIMERLSEIASEKMEEAKSDWEADVADMMENPEHYNI